MRKTVFDSSALLALIRKERGRERVAELLLDPSNEALVSAVNVSEAQRVLIRQGVPEDEAWGLLHGLFLHVIPFDEEQARIAGSLMPEALKHGLSLGDRACLALALHERCVLVSADRPWKEVQAGVEIELIRS